MTDARTIRPKRNELASQESARSVGDTEGRRHEEPAALRSAERPEPKAKNEAVQAIKDVRRDQAGHWPLSPFDEIRTV